MRMLFLIVMMAMGSALYAGDGGPVIHINFEKNISPLKVFVNDVLVAMVYQEDLIIHVPGPGRYVIEMRNEEKDQLGLVDVWGNGAVYYQYRSAFGGLRAIDRAKAEASKADERKKMIVEGMQVPRGLPLPK